MTIMVIQIPVPLFLRACSAKTQANKGPTTASGKALS